MRILRNIIVTLLLIALLGISIVGIMVEFPTIYHYHPTRINELGRSFLRVMRPGNLLLGAWFGLALATVLVFLMTVLRPRKQMKIEVQMGGGRVVILDSAIKRYIRSALAELPGVTVRRIDLRDTRLGVSTDLYADVRAAGNLPVLERQMIQRVRGALAEDLGISSIGEVHVFIRDFEVAERIPVHTAVRRPQAREPQPEESEPEPAPPPIRTAPVTAPEFTRPTASTGPFDQVPMPAPRIDSGQNQERAAKATTAEDSRRTETTQPPVIANTEAPAQPAGHNYFTPAPPTGAAARVTDLGPKDVYVLAEAAHESSAVTDLPGPTDEIATNEEAAGGSKPRKRGLFALFGGAETSTKSADQSEAETRPNAEYKPETATESIEPFSSVSDTGSGADDERAPAAAAKTDDQPESSSSS